MVPINWHLKADEVDYILADSGADILVCHADLLPQIRDGLSGDRIKVLVVPTPPEIAAAFNVPPELTARARRHDRLGSMARRACAVVRSPIGRTSPMFYTSGTTGLPKGVRRRPMRPEQLAAAERVVDASPTASSRTTIRSC